MGAGVYAITPAWTDPAGDARRDLAHRAAPRWAACWPGRRSERPRQRRMSVDFDPVRLAPSRRRLDPVVIGVVASRRPRAGVAVVKPWATGPEGRRCASASADRRRIRLDEQADRAGPAIRLASVHAPIWADLAPIVTPHDAWGVRAVEQDTTGQTCTPSAADFVDLWTPATSAPPETRWRSSTGTIGRSSCSASRSRAPKDPSTRGSGGSTATASSSGSPPSRSCRETSTGSFLYLRPGVDGAPFTDWSAGEYRIDVLVNDGIQRIDVELPDPSGIVPPLDAAPGTPLITVAATDSDIVRCPGRPFARPTAWASRSARCRIGRSANPRRGTTLALYDGAHVASVSLPRASGLGVMLSPGAIAGIGDHHHAFRRRAARSMPRRPWCRRPSIHHVGGTRSSRRRAAARGGPASTRSRSPGPTTPGRTRAPGTSSCGPTGVSRRAEVDIGYAPAMPRPLSRKIPLAELHCHLGGAVTPAIMWGIAHSQGIKLPTKDYWEFRDMITVSAAAEPLVRRLPPAVPLDRAHPELTAGGRTLGLRGRRRRLSQEQRHDHGAALQPDEAEPRRRAGPRPHHRGSGPRHGQGAPRIPDQAGPAVLPRPRLPVRAQRDHRREGDQLARPGRRRDRHRGPRIGDVPGGRLPAPLPARPAVRPRA